MTKIDWTKALELYLIAGTQDVAEGRLLPFLEEAIAGGITCFQYREKGFGALKEYSEITEMAYQCQIRCQKAKIPFVVNDDVMLAVRLKADAVHVGQSDLAVKQTLGVVSSLGIEVGLSINNLAQFKVAKELPELAYVGIGPIFPTQSKNDAQPVVGLKLLQEVHAINTQIPKVAIGGITVANCRRVKETGVSGLAVISALTKSSTIKQTIAALKVKGN